MATYHAGKRIQGGTVGTTFSDDFSSTTGWTAVASIVKVIPPALHFDGQRESIEGVGYDLGAGNVSDTKWVLRAKYDVTAEDHTGLTSGNLVYFGLSDVNQGTGVASNQDFIGLGAIVSSGTYKYHPCEAVNQNLLVSENNSPFAHLPVVETIYVEIIRISSTSYSVELFSDPSYSTSIEKETDTCDANTDNLRYIKCVCGYGAQTGLGNLYQGNIYDLEFYNNVSSVAEANSKFQLGSRWEQTDTRTIYHKDDEYKVHTFTTTGQTFNVTGSGDVEYLVVAGGAGGGHGGSHEPGGGGGAGGFRTGIGHAVTAQNYAITVGAGGAGSLTASANGANGSDSIFGTVTSNGGGGAASGTAASGHASNGGSGGGGSAITGSHIGGLGTSGQGFTGGTGFRAPDYEGGGGGGAGEVGESPISGASRGGNGGDGLQSSINGTATYYAGGGGGGVEYAETPGTGGRGGGGNGGVGNGGSGSNATGYGSGGGGGDNRAVGNADGGNGSTGIVIIRYSTLSGITATGGDTVTTINSAWIEERAV